MQKLITIAIFLLLFPLLIFGKTITGKVISVIDGDTIRMLTPTYQNIKIRLACIDTPEKKQAFGQKAKQHLSDMIFGKNVTVKTHGKGIHGRVIGTIFLYGHDINREQVEDGMAWVYRKYCNDSEYYKAEKYAKEHKIGLWIQPNPIPPWEWRHFKKKHYSNHKYKIYKPIEPSSSLNSQNFTCGSKRYCSQMNSCEEAKFYLNNCGLKHLDRDHDGVPCEKLCR